MDFQLLLFHILGISEQRTYGEISDHSTSKFINFRACIKGRRVPSTVLSIASKQNGKQMDFIKLKYIPRGINLDDPCIMKRESIVKLFKHIAAREVSHGVQDAFGFKNILSSLKKGALLPSRYSSANSGANVNITPAPAPQRKSKSQRREAAGNHNYHAESPGTQSSTQQQQAFYHPGVTPLIPTMPGLSLDPAFSVDPPIDLDSELDPTIHFGTISPGMVTAPVATSPHDHSLGDPKLVDNINGVPAAEGGNTADTLETNTVDMVGKRQSQ